MELAMANGFGGIGFTEMNEQEKLNANGGSTFGFLLGLTVGWNEGYADGLTTGGSLGLALGTCAGAAIGGPGGAAVLGAAGCAIFGLPAGIACGVKEALDTAHEYSQRY